MNHFHDILERLGLSQYHDIFVEEAFDSWDILVDITEADLDSLGVKLGHRRILQRAIAEFRRGSQTQSQSLIDPNLQPTSTTNTDNTRSEDETASAKTGTTGSTRAKRKYRRHPKADEHAPERPPSAYVLFSNQVREELKGQELSFTEIAKLVGERWQVLSSEQREPFENKSQALKEKYYQALAEYKKTPEYEEYQAYLEDFKAKHDRSQPDGKQARKKNAAAPSARSNSIERNGSVTDTANNSTWTDGWPPPADGRTSGAYSPADPSRAVLDWRSQTVLNSPSYETQQFRAGDGDYTNSPRYSPGIGVQQFYPNQQAPISSAFPPQQLQQQQTSSTSFRPLDPGVSARAAPPSLSAFTHPGSSRYEAPSPTSSHTSLWPPLAVDRSARRTRNSNNHVPRLPHGNDDRSSSTTASSTAGSYNSNSTTNTTYPPTKQTHSSDGALGINSRHLPPPIPSRNMSANAPSQQSSYPVTTGSGSSGSSATTRNDNLSSLPLVNLSFPTTSPPGAKDTSDAAVQASIATLLRAGEHVSGYGRSAGGGSGDVSRKSSYGGGGSGSAGGGGGGELPLRGAKETRWESNDSEETTRPGS